MRATLWLLGLFALAVVTALFVGENPGTVTVYWPPDRIDLSMNLVVFALALVFVLLHLALRGLSALLEMPGQAQRWRAQQKERGAHAALLEALGHQVAGRFVRARKAALLALSRGQALGEQDDPPPHAAALRGMAHLVVAESAHALQDQAAREAHLRQILEGGKPAVGVQEIREGAQLRAARWLLQDRDPAGALARLDALPQGAQRRTLALRTRLKASQLARQTQAALETTRLLAKHHAFSAPVSQTLLRGLAHSLIQDARDPAQLQRAWQQLEPREREMPDVALEAARRLLELGGSAHAARAWLQPLWTIWLQSAPVTQSGTPALAGTVVMTGLQRVRLVQTLAASLRPAPAAAPGASGAGADDAHDAAADRQWLARIESAQQSRPQDPHLQYLAGLLCKQRQLWGKARQLLEQASTRLPEPELRQQAWRALAELAEQRGDATAAAQAWRQAALAGR